MILIGLIVPNFLLAQRFSQNGEIVYDSKTQLYWQSNPSTKKFTWDEAKDYCQNLTYGGKIDWRLPNLYELKSLMDYKKYIVTNRIKIKTYNWYWTSSVTDNDNSIPWGVDFNRGDGWYHKSRRSYALCMRENE